MKHKLHHNTHFYHETHCNECLKTNEEMYPPVLQR